MDDRGSQPDLVVIRRPESGPAEITIIDLKSSRTVSLEHRLQVSVYAMLIRQLYPEMPVNEAILYRPPVNNPAQWTEQELADLNTARTFLRLDGGALLSFADRPERYHDLIHRTILDSNSTARKITSTDFQSLPYHLAGKCDPCPHNQFCIASATASNDLSLIPYLTERNKRQLTSQGITTIGELITDSAGATARFDQLKAIPGLAARLSETVSRAESYEAWLAGNRVESMLHESGYSSLPSYSADQHPNLIRIFIDIQRDMNEGRVAVLGALVSCLRDGLDENAREESIVCVADAPVTSDSSEAEFVSAWIRDILGALKRCVSPDREGRQSAPMHFYFWDSSQISAIRNLVNRQHGAILGIEAIMSLMMQSAAFDSTNMSVLADEIEHQRALPMLCQSLQAVSRWMGYEWPSEIVDTFRTRQFDALRRESDTDRDYFVPARSRFRSDLPSEYLYAAWSKQSAISSLDLSAPGWRHYQNSSIDLVEKYQAHRLNALKRITSRLRTNRQSTKTSFDLFALGRLSIRRETAIESVREFIAVERHLEMAEWRRTGSQSVNRRLLMGETLLAQYSDEDQDIASRLKIREARLKAKSRAKLTDTEYESLSEVEKKDFKWSLDDVTIRLRMNDDDLPIPISDVLANTRRRQGDFVVVAPASAVDSRRTDNEQVPFALTARQLLHQWRGVIQRISDSGTIEIQLQASTRSEPGFVFRSSLARPPDDGVLFTIEQNPDSWPAHRQWSTVEKIRGGHGHGGYALIDGSDRLPRLWTDREAAAQELFMDGLVRFADFDLHASQYELSKQEYIGRHGSEPLLLVQGPPGTGKSTTTGFAVWSRIQGALASGRELRIAVACKTHSATDVLLRAILRAQHRLQEIRGQNSELFETYFDARLLSVPIYRFEARDVSKLPSDIKTFSSTSSVARLNEVRKHQLIVVGATTNALGKLGKPGWTDGNPPWDILILDEASQMSVPEYLVASVGLKSTGRLIVVGDHRQMPPIVRQNWEDSETEALDPYAMYRSLFDVIRFDNTQPRIDIKFSESFRIHQDVAEYLRREIYIQDEIELHSTRTAVLTNQTDDPFLNAVLNTAFPIVLVVHDETGSQQRNLLEQELSVRILLGLEGLEGPKPWASLSRIARNGQKSSGNSCRSPVKQGLETVSTLLSASRVTNAR